MKIEIELIDEQVQKWAEQEYPDGILTGIEALQLFKSRLHTRAVEELRTATEAHRSSVKTKIISEPSQE